MNLPRLWRRKKDGKEQGSWHVYVRNKPINLATQDADEAKKRRLRAVRGQRNFRDHVQAAGADATAQLGETVFPKKEENADGAVVQQQPAPPFAPSVPPAPSGSSDATGSAAPETVDAEPIPPDQQSWADDVAGTAGATNEATAGAPVEAPRLRLTDFAWFKGALVTCSKVAVGLQLHGQAWAMRLVGDVEAGRVGPPPTREPEDPESMAAFMKIASAPWGDDDPREPGRQAYERTIVALIPEELPVPAWMKWLEAPIITAINTAPIQWSTGTKIKPEQRAPDAPGDAEATPPMEAPTVGAAA